MLRPPPPPPDTALTDGRVLLRAYHPADADAQVEAARESTAEVYPWLAWCHPDYARDDAVARLADRDLLDRKVACGDERRGD